jgi:hypothetical protein
MALIIKVASPERSRGSWGMIAKLTIPEKDSTWNLLNRVSKK